MSGQKADKEKGNLRTRVSKTRFCQELATIC